MSNRLDRARILQLSGQLFVLRELHAGRIATRADLTRRYGMSRGSASELTGRLQEAELLDERPAEPNGRRGRPGSVLGPHPNGPVVCAVDIGHEAWTVALVALGGGVVDRRQGRTTDRRASAVLASAARAAGQLVRANPGRLAAVSIAMAGTVSGLRIIQASTLRWRDVDVARYFGKLGCPVLLGNDATLAGVAEARRGAATGARVSLQLTVEVGIGGVLIVDGKPQVGATGAGGEFGHLPFGDPTRRCPCGARGCWDVEVDGRALARILGRRRPADPRTLADRIIADARGGDPTALDAVTRIAVALGRGTGGLVNALDPELVTLAGLGVELLDVAGSALRREYLRALMAFRRRDPPPLVASTTPRPASLVGAAEVGFDELLTEPGLHRFLSAASYPE
jgi:predicted NBD/HSP70 family sugar kinase